MSVLDQGIQELSERFNSINIEHKENTMLKNKPDVYKCQMSLFGELQKSFYPAGYDLIRIVINSDSEDENVTNTVTCLKLLAETEDAFEALPNDYQRSLHLARIICKVMVENHCDEIVDTLEATFKNKFSNDVSTIVNFDHGVCFTKTSIIPVSNEAIDYIRNRHIL